MTYRILNPFMSLFPIYCNQSVVPCASIRQTGSHKTWTILPLSPRIETDRWSSFPRENRLSDREARDIEL